VANHPRSITQTKWKCYRGAPGEVC
jgi:hypothetical protein